MSSLRHSSSDTGLTLYITHQLGQVHFRLSRLKPACHRSLRQLLKLISARALQKEIGIATDVFNGRKRDCVDTLLDYLMTGSGKPCDPMSERSDEVIEFSGWQRAIDPAVAFSQVCVVVLCAQHHFQRSPATHESREMLGATRTRNDTKSRLELAEDRRLPSGETHVAREYEFASDSAYATFDLRNRDEAAGAQIPV